MSLPVTPSGRPLGLKPARVPHHTLGLARATVDVDALPPCVSMRQLCPPVDDQGSQGGCTAHAIKGAIAIVCRALINAALWPWTLLLASRAAIYYLERAIEGDTGDDAGAMIVDGLHVVEQGIVPESEMPYDDRTWTIPPSPVAMEAGAAHVVTNHEPIALDLPTILGTLAQGFPVVAGVQVTKSFEDAPGGMVPLPGASEPSLGGHAICLIGYDRERQLVEFRNSWSASWGDQGYGWLPFAFVQNGLLFTEAHAVRALR